MGSAEEMQTTIDTSAAQVQQQKTAKHLGFTPPSALAEIFSLIKSDFFKSDKMLMRNLSMLIQQILKQFDVAREELELSNQQISVETIHSIADVLTLDSIEQNLLEALGDFFYQISLKKRDNFQIISQYCSGKSGAILEKLNGRLMEIAVMFHSIKSLTPSKSLGYVESRQMS